MNGYEKNEGIYANGKQAIRGQAADWTAARGRNTFLREGGGAAASPPSSQRGCSGRNTFLREGGGAALGPAVWFGDSTALTLGGTGATDGNVFDGAVELVNSSQVVIQGNFIGVDTGGVGLGNSGDGIVIDSLSSNVTVGGSLSGAGNQVRYNGGPGIRSAGINVTVEGNTVTDNATDLSVEGGDTHLRPNTLGSLLVAGGIAYVEGSVTIASVTVIGGTLALPGASSTLTVTGNYTQSGGTTDQGPSSVVSVQGVLDQSNGFYYLTDASLQAVGGVFVNTEAVFIGTGTITGDVVNSAFFSVSATDAVGSLHIVGNYTQTTTGFLHMSYVSTASLDQLFIDGLATFDGTLGVWQIGDPLSPGDRFDLIHYGSRSGEFASYSLPFYPGGWLPQYDVPANTFSLLAQ